MKFSVTRETATPTMLNYPWAALCIIGAVYFIFRG